MRHYGRLAILALALAGAAPYAQELGTITFPTSGSAAAQAAFLDGVKALHSFQFDEAASRSSAPRRLIPPSRWPTGARR